MSTLSYQFAADERPAKVSPGDVVQHDRVLIRKAGQYHLVGTVYRVTKPYARYELEMYDGTFLMAGETSTVAVVISTEPKKA